MVQRDPVWLRFTWAEGIRSMLTIRSLNVSYGDSQVLWDVHLDVRQVRWYVSWVVTAWARPRC